MLRPALYNRGFMDDFFDDFFPTRDRNANDNNRGFGVMKTDVKDTGDNYELDIELPGCNKEDVKAHVKDGYLVIEASTNSSNDEKDENGKYIRRERYSGSMSRSFYVGEDVTEKDIHAKFENGMLSVTVPKEKPEQVKEPKYISIEG